MADYDIGEAFRAIEHELIASMTRNLTNHKVEELVEGYEWAQWQVMQLEALEEYKRRNAAKFPKQFSEINDRIEQEINTSYSAAQTAQEREILKRIHNGTPAPNAPFTGIQGEFFKVNDRKMNALTDAVTNDMQKAEYAVLRMTNDKYRQIIFNAQVYANSGAATYEKAVDMATKDFLSAGINCIQYKDGRRVPIDAYAEMALRTANKRAYLQGEGDMRKKWGIHTVILNKRTNACPKCAPFCGQIIVDDVWSGGTAEEAEKGGYLLMSDCIAHGLYHPNCQDSHTTYFGDLLGDDEDEEQTESEITPLPENEVQANTDSAEYLLQQYTPEEQERNIELYNAQQRLNHCERQVQRFERLEEFSLDEGNKQSYGARLKEWKEKSRETGLELDEMKKLQKREGIHVSQLVYSGETVRRVNFSFDSNDEEQSENSTGENVANSEESGIIKLDETSVSNTVLRHSSQGEFTAYKNPKKPEKGGGNLKKGGHGQANIEELNRRGIEYHIVKEYANGVRVGYIPKHKDNAKRSGIGQSWFPANWTEDDIRQAGESVLREKQVVFENKNSKGEIDSYTIYGEYKGVTVGIFTDKYGKLNDVNGTIFPDSLQRKIGDFNV